MTIERELFDWAGWDGDQECMFFYKPVLKVCIGKYPAGTKFDSAVIVNSEDGCKLQLVNHDVNSPEATSTYKPDKVMGEYNLHYLVGDTLSEAS